MTEVRDALRDRVRAQPGVHFNQLCRELGIATGQAQYHLRRLHDGGEVVTERLRDRTHYYPRGYDPWDRRTLALLRRETAREIIVTVLERDEPPAAELADDLGVARSTVAWHVSTLEEAGIVEKTYGDRGQVHLDLTRPEAVRRLLGEIRPSLPDRLVDRFTRLVDASFYD